MSAGTARWENDLDAQAQVVAVAQSERLRGLRIVDEVSDKLDDIREILRASDRK